MAQSSQAIYDQMMDVQRGMQPMLDNQAGAPDYFRKKISEAYNYNLPAIKNAASLEAGAYNLPGKLMSQYDQEYGGKTGIGSMARMNSILGNIGQQFGMSNAAWNLVDQNKMRMDEVVKGVTDQYMSGLDAYKTKWGMLSPLWQTMYSEEQANARAYRPPGPSSGDHVPDWPGGNGEQEEALEYWEGKTDGRGNTTGTDKMIGYYWDQLQNLGSDVYGGFTEKYPQIGGAIDKGKGMYDQYVGRFYE